MTVSRSGDYDLVESWYDVAVGYDRVHRALSAAGEHNGLPETWFTVLFLLDRAPERRLAMTPLAQHLAITSGGLTKLIDKLERAGLTERRGADGDRRLVFTTLTAAGRRAVQTAVRQRASVLREAVAGINQSRLSELSHLLAAPGTGTSASDG